MKPNFISIWDRRDWGVGAFCALAALVVYVWTCAPNVTLLDSGEFLVASSQFGVPHPTGYPLWTLLCGLFQLLPLGNTAWEGNLFSAVCGALAVGLTGALLHQSAGWLFRELAEERGMDAPAFDLLRVVVSVAGSLTLTFSISMWSQAVITEVYTLHALLVLLYLIAIYSWIRDTSKIGGLIASIFFWALGMSNHHLVLVLLPVTVILVLLLRRDLFWDFLIFLMMAGALVLLAFASLSDEVATRNTAERFAWLTGILFVLLLWLRKGRVKWLFLPGLVVAVCGGFLPYLYMPLASSTNPPMNWAYTRDADGFYFSINRSQYSGRLSDLVDGTVGRVLGSKPPGEEKEKRLPGVVEVEKLNPVNMWAGFFWIQLAKSGTPVFMVAFFLTLLAILYLSAPQRAWILLLYVSFILAGFLEPILNGARIDQAGWLLQLPYHTYTFALFILVSGTGLSFSLIWLRGRLRFGRAWLLWPLLLPLVPLWVNAPFCSQRDKWFGWEFGHEMLKDMPPGSVLFGGTDPGRFVPTYMILGESFEKPGDKRDPGFDRRDLYIITQNALIDEFYLRYIRDQYGPGRPKEFSRLEKWLGRDRVYPLNTLILPTDEEVKEVVKKGLEEERRPGMPRTTAATVNGPVAKLIFEKNKSRHTFFVEESFSMPWTYPYALPEGLIYRLNPEPLPEIPPAVVVQDRKFWEARVERLLRDPLFEGDIDAQRSYSKLRVTMGNIYRFRQKEAVEKGRKELAQAMGAEAALAYQQALQLWNVNPEAVQALLDMLTEEEKTAEALELIEKVAPLDGFNNDLFTFNMIAMQRNRLQGEIQKWRNQLKADPADSEAAIKLCQVYVQIQDKEQLRALVNNLLRTMGGNRKFMQAAIASYLQVGEEKAALDLARRWEKEEPKNERVAFLVSRLVYVVEGNGPVLRKAVSHALELGGDSLKEEYRLDPVFAPLRAGGGLDELLNPPPAPDFSGKKPAR